MQKIMENQNQKEISYQQAIRLKCLDCCGGITSEIRLCTCKECPLYNFRMGSKSKTEKVDKKAS